MSDVAVFIKKRWDGLGTLKGLLLGLVVLMIVMGSMNQYFFTVKNLMDIVNQMSIVGIVAIGQTFVILSGGIDLSVGSIVALAGVFAAGFQQLGLGMWASVGLALVVSALIGFSNGFVTTKFIVQPFIITLGTMGIVRGWAMVFTNAEPVTQVAGNFSVFGAGTLFGIPNPVLIYIAVAVIAWITLKKTRFGEYTYAIGGNEEASRLAGIRINFHKTMIYTISGLSAGISGVILASKLDSGVPTVGQGYELDAIAAVVIGGTALIGGEGGLIGTIIGMIIIQVLSNGLNLLNVSAFYQDIFKGALIIAAVIIDSYVRKKRR